MESITKSWDTKWYIYCTIISTIFTISPILVVICVGIVLLILSIHYLYCHITPFARKFNRLPGASFIPLCGCIDIFKFDKKQFLDVDRCPFKGGGRYWLAWKSLFVTTDLNVVQQVMTSSLNKHDFYELVVRVIGPKSIFISKVDDWKPTRKLMIQSFKGSMFHEFLEVFNKHTNTLLEMFDKKGEIDVQDVFGKYAMDIALETLLDQGPESTQVEEQDALKFYQAFKKTLEAIFIIRDNPWLQIWWLWWISGWEKQCRDNTAHMKKYILNKVNKNISALEKGHIIWKPKVAHLVCANWQDPEEIYLHTVGMLVAAIDTTDCALTSSIFLMACHPDVQQKVFEEVRHIMRNDVHKDVTMEDVNQMHYLDMVIKESMRVVTPVPILGRKPTTDINIGNGVIIPKNCNIQIPVWLIHKDPKIYPEPNKFIPERFLPEETARRHPCSYMPFATTPRNCIGQKYAMVEIKVALAKIILKFEISTPRKLDDTSFEAYGVLTKISGKIPVKFTRRQAQP